MSKCLSYGKSGYREGDKTIDRRAKCHNYKDKWRILNKEAIKLKESVFGLNKNLKRIIK
jgi:hypothetical protein